jgi:hypothetical protein
MTMEINFEMLANYLIDRNIEIHSIEDTIYTLIDYGLTKEQIESFGFDRDIINDVYLSYMTEV